MIYLTSDLHLNHNRGFIYEPRGFHSVEEMNEAIIDLWNILQIYGQISVFIWARD